MESDVMPAGLSCPHCGAEAVEVTYIEVGNHRHDETLRWVTESAPTSMSVYYRFDCGGETGYFFDAVHGISRMDGETEQQCPLREVE